MMAMQPPPARTAHGPAYWLLIGWWWAPAKWIGRVLLWAIPPIGIWRSVRHGRKVREERHRRGWEQQQKAQQPPPVT